MVILGIDPGSRVTGYGVIDTNGKRNQYLACGCVRTKDVGLAKRLQTIFQGIQEIVTQFQPDEVAIEKVFMHRNADSALKLGQARGAAICAVATSGLPVIEYSPTAIKLAVVGMGHAQKQQVQHMIRILLGLTGTPTSDAADALAVAICHAHSGDIVKSLSEINNPKKINILQK